MTLGKDDDLFDFNHHREQIDGRYTDRIYDALNTVYVGLTGWIQAERKWYQSFDDEIRKVLDSEDIKTYEEILQSTYDIEDELINVTDNYKIYDDPQSLDFEWGLDFVTKEAKKLFEIAIKVKKLRDRFQKLTDQSKFES